MRERGRREVESERGMNALSLGMHGSGVFSSGVHTTTFPVEREGVSESSITVREEVVSCGGAFNATEWAH